ncbi:HERC1 [Symbiodinium sp. CCMP2592]|nr:HERC1 [Symbiodinium sp. CCMP2592]
MAWPSIVAFGKDESSWILKIDDPIGLWSSHMSCIPRELATVLDERSDSIEQVALGPDGEWFILLDDQDRSTFFGNSSDLFAAALHAAKDADGKMQISWVAFGPQNSFFVYRVDGEPFWHGLPEELEELLAKRPRDVKHLALGRPTGWWVLFHNGVWKWHLPPEHGLSDWLKSSEAYTLNHVYLGNNGEYFIETKQHSHWKAGDSLSRVLSYYCNRSSRLEKVKSALVECPTLLQAHAELMTVLMKVLEEHREDCYFDQLLEAIKSKLLFDPHFTRLYSFSPACYGQRGGYPYFKPCGWLRCSLAIENFEEYSGWCIAYHGTSCQNVASIMLRGLRKPGDEGVGVAHGQAYSKSGCKIYVSPSIEYAAFPVYAEFLDIERNHWAQLVLECRVRPASFVVKPGSLGNKYWPEHLRMDQNFETNSELEWLIDTPEDVAFTGLMIREFGEAANEEIYGSLVRQVTLTPGSKGPEFEWTKLRAAEYERLQYCI